MRAWAAVALCAVGCVNSDDEEDDSAPSDTDVSVDTDTNTSDTDDTPTDTDTTLAELDCTFEKCGGDVVGDWDLDGICFPDLGNLFEQLCATSSSTYAYDATGTMSFDEDGSYASYTVATLSGTVTFPAECNSGLDACADWDTLLYGLTCTGDIAVQCDCVLSIGPYPQEETGSWSYAGDDLLIDGGAGTPEGGSETTRFGYCQEDDSLKMQAKGGVPIQFILSR